MFATLRWHLYLTLSLLFSSRAKNVPNGIRIGVRTFTSVGNLNLLKAGAPALKSNMSYLPSAQSTDHAVDTALTLSISLRTLQVQVELANHNLSSVNFLLAHKMVTPQGPGGRPKPNGGYHSALSICVRWVATRSDSNW
eukprot:8647781-Pyramimonas_sp.AAC.1